MFLKEMKPLIKYAMELDIFFICTNNGYNGGDILHFKSEDINTIKKIKSFCHNLEIDTNIKPDKSDSKVIHIYCAFGTDRFKIPEESDGIYDLKDDIEKLNENI